MPPVLVGLLLVSWVTLVGRGLLRLAGAEGDATLRPLLLAPALGLVATTLVLNVLVALGCPLRDVRFVPLLVVAPLAVLGALAVVTDLRRGARSWSILLPLTAPLVLIANRLAYGLPTYSGTQGLDGWAYCAYADYLGSYACGTAGGLTPLAEFGAALSWSRYISAAWLSVIGQLAPAEGPPGVCAPYLWSVLFAYGGSCLHLGRTYGLRGGWTKGYAVAAMVGGPIPMLVVGNAYDNLATLYLAPTLLALAGRRPLTSRVSVLAGLVGAAGLVTYVELAVVSLGLALVVVGTTGPDRPPARRFFEFLATLVLACAPSALHTVSFFVHQVLASHSSLVVHRPGNGSYPELLSWGGAFAFAWFPLLTVGSTKTVVGLLGGVCSLLALRGLARPRHPVLPFALLPLLGALYLAGVQRYDYGAFKLLAISWWAIVLGLFIELARGSAAERSVRTPRPWSWWALAGGIALVNAHQLLAHSRASGWLGITTRWTLGWSDLMVLDLSAALLLLLLSGTYLPSCRLLVCTWLLANVQPHGAGALPGDVAGYRRVKEVSAIVGERPVALGVEDLLASHWALWFLDRSVDLRLDFVRAHAAGSKDARAWNHGRPRDGMFVLTDAYGSATGFEVVWEGGPYRLLRPAGPTWATIVCSGGRYGGGRRGERPSLGVGPEPTELYVLTSGEGTVELTGTSDGAGRIRWRPGGTTIVDAGEEFRVLLPVAAGSTRIEAEEMDGAGFLLRGLEVQLVSR